jgi:DNA replication protein DnaC/DNA-binding XRE family transcriptional regulator
MAKVSVRQRIETPRKIDSRALLARRLEKGLTQQEVADRVGISLRTYRRYERNDFSDRGAGASRLETHQILGYIAQFFEVSLDVLLPPLPHPRPGTLAVIDSSSPDPNMVFERWDQSALVEFDRQLFDELRSLRFIAERRDVLLSGAPGVGKTFLASALAHLALRAGMTVDFVPVEALLAEAFEQRDLLDQLAARCKDTDLLILDDFASGPLEVDATRSLCRLLRVRHGRHSTLITSNRAPTEWFAPNDETLTAGVLDRFINNAYELEVRGESYRPRLKPMAPPAVRVVAAS